MNHILEGHTTARNAIGNGLADTAADHGHKAANHSEAQCVLSHVAKTQVAYEKLILRLQRFAIAVVCVQDADLDEGKNKGPQGAEVNEDGNSTRKQSGRE